MSATLESVYYNPRHPSSFANVSALYKAARAQNPDVTLKAVREWLLDQPTYTIHAPARKRYPRNKTIGCGLFHSCQMDLLDVSGYAKWNSGTRFLLTFIDLYSRRAFVRPLKTKTAHEVCAALESILDSLPGAVTEIGSDWGKEFNNKLVKEMLEKRGVRLRFLLSDVKGSVIERYHRTLRSRLARQMYAKGQNRFLPFLQQVVDNINASYHRTLKMAPNDVTADTFLFEIPRSNADDAKLAVGDLVRINRNRDLFQKESTGNYSEEIFVVSGVVYRQPIVYRVRALNGDPIEGVFYDEELLRVTNTGQIYRIEKKLAEKRTRRGTEVLVKWLGYKEPTWILKKDMIQL